MTFFEPSLRSELHELARADVVDLPSAMIVLARAFDPTVDATACREQLGDLADHVRTILDRQPDEAGRVLAFSSAMRDLGFRGDDERYYDPRNSSIAEVLATRTGIPISLSVVYMEVAARAGLELHGVGFPGHFLLSPPSIPDTFLDPFFGVLRSRESCARLLQDITGGTMPFHDQFLDTVDERRIFVRVLRNLKTIYRDRGAMEQALELCDLILLFDPEQPLEYRDRGTLSLALGEWNRAVDDLSTYLAMIPNTSDRAVILGQLQWVLAQQASVH